jgi:hypothetical protein
MPIDAYDPHTPPDPAEWLALGEEERIQLAIAYHHSIGDRGENERTHCLLHAIVENQIAMGGRMEQVRERVRQLMAQGLDRHQALHACCYVLARHMHFLTVMPRGIGDQDARYFRELGRMNARKWLGVLRGLPNGGQPMDTARAP